LADPRAGDVAQAQRLLDQAAADGIAKLPVLSAAELWVLCGDQQVLADEAELAWWTSKTDAEREKYGTAMVDFLVHRQLIRTADGQDPASLPMTAELAMIVAARQRPAVVAVGTLADGLADQAPRMYGLAEGDQPPRVLVSEVIFPARQPAFGPMHHFSLVSPERAGRILATWAASPPGIAGRIIDVYQHRPGAELSRDRIVASALDGTLVVIRERPDRAPEPPQPMGTGELASLVTAMLVETSP
jgi:hypothetical protein